MTYRQQCLGNRGGMEEGGGGFKEMMEVLCKFQHILKRAFMSIT